MFNEELPDHVVYSPPVIDFVTVVAETCLFLENASEGGRDEFIDKSVKILPLLYLKTSLLKVPEPVFGDGAERFVTEEDYLFVKEQMEQLLGVDDTYLEVFHPDMALSDTPIAAFVSENMADIYQELKDFAANYQTADTDVMNDALVVCLEAFAEHWGQKLLNALRALHALRYSDSFGEEETEAPQGAKLDRNAFLGFLHDDEAKNEYGKLLD
ncbi:MAG: DUF5063 domain-containing protein [Paludibacter sp.]|nr:DUF5063 domain-containing protein [Paludibacter sp.]MDD3489347.1 DUF5063 domain-containing protein [Paludibacter sp.]